jgi:ankyrin repeat protein
LTIEILTAGRLARIESLIQYGADLNLVGADGHTPLEAAAVGGTPELIELCLRYGARSGSAEMRGPLEWAAWAGKLENVKCLLKHGADVEARDKYGMTVLMELVKYERQYKMVEAFILAGADVNARLLPQGWTPLTIAKMHQNWQVVQLLEKHGAKP